jgi:hypothetical protein
MRQERNAPAAQPRYETGVRLRRHLSHRPGREDHLPEEPQRPRARQRDVPRSRRGAGRRRDIVHRRRHHRGRADDRRLGKSARALPGLLYKGHFDDHVAPDPERERRDHWKKKTIIEAVWGWAITAHKAQGSQWENIIVYDDGLGRTADDRARWLYTAITRAERGLVLLD